MRSTLAKHLADIAELSLKFLDLVTLGGNTSSGTSTGIILVRDLKGYDNGQ